MCTQNVHQDSHMVYKKLLIDFNTQKIKSQMNNNRISTKAQIIWNTILINNPWVTRNHKNNFKLNGNKNVAYKNLWSVANMVVQGKLIALSSYIRKNIKV